MNNQIEFIKFKNLLNKYNILLFDGDYRIVHYKYEQLIKSGEQYGGSNIFSNNSNSDFLINKINSHSENLLRIFVYSLMENNTSKVNYILDTINKN